MPMAGRPADRKQNLGLGRYFGRRRLFTPFIERLSVRQQSTLPDNFQTCRLDAICHHDGSRGIRNRKKRRPASKAFDHRHADEGKATHAWRRPGAGYIQSRQDTCRPNAVGPRRPPSHVMLPPRAAPRWCACWWHLRHDALLCRSRRRGNVCRIGGCG